MLERARATSLALLGATAAVGLAIAALAFNQGWPLIEGSSIPRIPPRREAIGAATVVARPDAGASGSAARGAAVRAGRDLAPSGSRVGGVGDGPAPVPDSASEFVVAPSAPVHPHKVDSPDSPGPQGDSPATQHPAESPKGAPPPSAQSEPAPTPTPSPTPAPVPTPVPAPPVATTSEAPPVDESDVPSWSHGNGHAYGRSESWHGESVESDDDGWDGDHGDESHGHPHDH